MTNQVFPTYDLHKLAAPLLAIIDAAPDQFALDGAAKPAGGGPAGVLRTYEDFGFLSRAAGPRPRGTV